MSEYKTMSKVDKKAVKELIRLSKMENGIALTVAEDISGRLLSTLLPELMERINWLEAFKSIHLKEDSK